MSRWLFVLLCSGCAAVTPQTIDLAAVIAVTPTPPHEIPLEVTTRTTGAPLELAVGGSAVRFARLEESLGHAVATAVAPWVGDHQTARAEGWQLLVDLWRAEAGTRAGSVEVRLAVRATLRTRRSHFYLGQTQAHCAQAGVAPADHAAPIVYACMSQIGRELAGWLGSIQP